ncbi:MAG TPA: serine--tRNA ligase [Armatimonadota bacterium]|nr:serine--tRNA ligase [Armatimonadota bacterium]
MLDPKIIRNTPEVVAEAMRRRHKTIDLDALTTLEEERRSALTRVESLKAERNAASQQIAERKKRKEDATEQIAAMRKLGDEIKRLDEVARVAEEQFTELMMGIPNIPDPSVPEGADSDDNVVVRTWGEPTKFSFAPKPHWELGESLGVLDFGRAAQIAQARFSLFLGAGAALERAILNYMLNLHTGKQGYTEVWPPALVSADSLLASGQLPKFEEDLFRLREGLYLSPTSECQLTNLHRGEIFEAGILPRFYTSYTPCFRAEAGSAGQESRGLIRQHQFDKVEMYKFVEPEGSMDELESLVANAEEVLQGLGLPYRVVLLCTGDMGFSSLKTYDLEVWMPGMDKYVEISSCSNCGDFQARRGQIRYRREAGARPELVHTLNGSGLAIGRTWAAVAENHQQADGTIRVPDALRPYMGIDVIG